MPLNRAQRSRLQRTRQACLESLESRRLMSFGPAVAYATPSKPYVIVTADLNKDGKLDLVTNVGIDANSKLIVRLGDGAGGFGAARELSAPAWGDYAGFLFVADLNNDTKPDLVLSDAINGYRTLFGNGDGTFQSSVETFGYGLVYAGNPSSGSGSALGLTTWFDGDWAIHIQANWSNNQGSFVPAGQDGYYWSYGSGFAPLDLNKDGYFDVVTGEGAVFLGSIHGLFFDWDHGAPLRGGDVAVGDFTGDGYSDAVSVSDRVAILRSNRDGTLAAPIFQTSNGIALSDVETADFNADGKLDVVVTDSDKATATVLLGNGDGTLRFGGSFSVGAGPSCVTVGDFNRDGRPDLAVANNGTTNFSVLLNDGNWTNLPPPPPPPPALSIGDVAVTEGNTGTRNAGFTVSLSKPAAADVIVYYGTGSGTAMPSEDFSGIGGSVTIPAGQTSATINIAVIGDQIPEPTETFAVNITGATNAMIVDAQGTGTILNDDGKRWKGPASGGNWSTASNWSPTGVPTTGDHVSIEGVSVNLGSSATIASLTLINGGTLNVGAAGNRVLRASSLAISGGGSKLNLNDNDLIVDRGNFSAINALVMQGLGGGTSGITSSAGNGSQTLALFDNGLVGATQWQGQTLSSGAIVGKYTFFGDVNLDGVVSGDDYTTVDAHLNTAPPAGIACLRGDANWDGWITGDDYTAIDAHLGLGLGNPLALSHLKKLIDE